LENAGAFKSETHQVFPVDASLKKLVEERYSEYLSISKMGSHPLECCSSENREQ
jgi:hypothetical protein